MWEREVEVATSLLRGAGLGERLEKHVSPSAAGFVTLICRLPYLRFSTRPEYVVFGIVMTPHRTLSASVMLADTGRTLHRINCVECNDIGVRAVIAELLDWWKQNKHHSPALA